ncbi:MAG: CDGSH iron-sulfur domain-containing protein [Actinomycetota bacterium]|nr:CDGSH iron-sulfur domain-containing protein [Actinomycetota bacterium]
MPASDVVRITPYRDGPLLVRGPVELLDGHGKPIPARRSTVALCRCGKSRLRPFCDGTHKLIGFSAPTSPRPAER